MHRQIKDNLVWKDGIVLQIENEDCQSEAVVRCDQEDQKILIDVYGRDRTKYLDIILHEFRDINESFANLEFSENIPKPDDHTKTVSYLDLLYFQEIGINKYFFPNTKHVYKIQQLLEGIYVEKRLTSEEVTNLAQDITDNYENWESINFALKKMNITSGCIEKSSIDLIMFTNTVQYLTKQRRVREFLSILKSKRLIFVEKWFPVINNKKTKN